ncbi:MAG: carboxypeptidase-like regulatory domain-containing protein [Candidatus Binatus sp.]
MQTRITRCHFLLLAMVLLLGNATGCSYLEPAPPPPGKISVQAVSWKLVKKLAEPNAGLSGHKVSVLNPTDKSVVASGTTDSTGIVEFDLPPGTYTLIGASDEPQSVQVQSGQTSNFKIVVH